MKSSGRRTAILAVVLVILLVCFGYLVLTYTRRVSGTSMLPTLEDGDLVVIIPATQSSVHVGDIIVYGPPCSTSGDAIIHRAVTIFSNGSIITKGDNNPVTDQHGGIAVSPVEPNCIIGKVVFVVPYLERIASLPYGVNYFIAVLIIVVILYLELAPERPQQGGSAAGEAVPPNPVPTRSTRDFTRSTGRA